jgi:tripartite ATP-independent transporter DctM subunit
VSDQAITLIAMAALMALIVLRVPVGVALGLVGIFGYAALEGWTKAGLVLGNVPLDLAIYTLSVVPLFALMGALSTSAKLSTDLFRAADVVFAGLRGSMALAAVGASAAFGAVCGSSLATAATISRVSIPEMLGAGYSPRLAAGSVAAGGTIGILVPPSLILIVYSIISQQSIAQLFAATLIPGVLLTVLYIVVVLVTCALNPSLAPKQPRGTAAGLVQALLRIWHVTLLFLLTLGGIYLGWYSPTEAAAVGAFGALVLSFVLGKLTWRETLKCFAGTVELTGSLFLIILGAVMFSYFVVQSRLSPTIIGWIQAAGLPPLAVILLLILFYIVLGCFLDGIGMVLVTVPIVFPIIIANGFDPVWFGVLLVIVIEIGLIHPPVGMNLFVIRAQAPEISIVDMYIGVLPFLIAPFILIALILEFPQLVLWLPHFLYG